MNTIVTVEQNNYRIGKLPAMQQFHVLRRVAPILTSMGVSASQLAELGKENVGEDGLLSMMGAAASVVARMDDKEVEYVIYTCLAVVSREQVLPQGSKYMNVLTGGRNLQFADITMDIMLRLTVEVLKENLSGFFPKLTGE